MKSIMRIVILCGMLFCVIVSNAQTYSTTLDVNNVNALIKPVGNQFSDWDGYPSYWVPIGEGTSTIYTSTLWIGGFDEFDNLHLSAEKFRQDGNDYVVGPLSYTNELGIADGVAEQWDYIWEVERSEIIDFLSNQNNSGYQIPQSILDWPAHGNTDLGQSHNLAPYFDFNEDGNYNPEDGDYPNIRGDKCLFFIFNDLCEHSESGGTKMGIEVHGMAYAFDVPEDDAFNNSVFLNYKIINRSDTTYDETYVGIFTDFDIGYADDDYIGCDVDRGSFYAYNGDDFDETANGQTGFGENPPAQSATLLGGPYMDNDGIDNPTLDGLGNQIVDESINGLNFGDGIIDNERLGMTGFYYFNNNGTGANPATLDPEMAMEYYNYMRGYWKDGSYLLYGGTGHYSGTNTTSTNAKFMFPGNPSSDTYNWGTNGEDIGAWSEETESNPPGDRRGMCSMGPFTFEPGDTAIIDLVYVYGVEVGTKSNSNDIMKQNIDIIRNGFINNTTPDGDPFIFSSSNQFMENINKFEIYPNPAKNVISINGQISSGSKVEVFNSNGKLVKSVLVSEKGSIISLSVEDLLQGFYFIKLKTDSKVITRKISIID